MKVEYPNWKLLHCCKPQTVETEDLKFYIQADIEYRDDCYILTADIPNGVKKEDIKLSFEMGVLTIEADSHPEKKGRVTCYFIKDEGHRKEFVVENFSEFFSTKGNSVEVPREPMNDADRENADFVIFSDLFDDSGVENAHFGSFSDLFGFERGGDNQKNLIDQSAADEKEGKHYLLEEIGHRIYKRSFKFQDVDPHGLSAKFTDGQLIVCLKKFRDNNIQISFSDEPNPVCRPKK